MTKSGLRATLLPILAAGLMAAGASPGWAGIITFNPSGNGAGAGAISGVSGFTYATSSVLASGLGAPTVGATFTVLYESVISGTTGVQTPVGAGFNLNNSGNQFTVIAAYQETITSINLVPGGGPGGPGGADSAVINLSLAPTQTNNFFDIFANTPGSANPATGTGAGFGTGTLVLSGSIVPTSFNGSFAEAGSISGSTFTPLTQAFNTSGNPTLNPTANSVVGGGGTQLTVAVNSFNAGFFVSSNPLSLLFSTTNSLPFSATAPLTGFYSAPGAAPNVVNPNTGTINGENGTNLMFQTVATNGISIIPEPTSIIPALTAMVVLPIFFFFMKRR